MAQRDEFGLSDKEHTLVHNYMQSWAVGRAAQDSGYSARQASRILKRPEVRTYIKSKLEEKTMTSDEILARLTEHARGSLADFVTVNADGTYHFDLALASRNGKMHLLKKITFNRGRLEVELNDPQAALVHLGKHYKLFTEKSQVADWRSELKEAGLDPEKQKEELVEQFTAALLAKSRTTTK